MTPHKQLFRHKPDEGVWGDCWRTAIACLLDIDPKQVPHFCHGAPGGEVVKMNTMEWLSERGLSYVSVVYPGETRMKDVLRSFGGMNPHVYFLFSGTSETGVNHTTIGHGEQIVHDPSLTNAGIIGPCDDGYYWVEVLVPVENNRTSMKAAPHPSHDLRASDSSISDVRCTRCGEGDSLGSWGNLVHPCSEGARK